jgi:hypothetical protein
MEGALGRTVVEAVAGLEVALGVSVGLASAALLRARGRRLEWVLAGALAGTFAVHLAAGYLSNLLEAAIFLGAAAALAAGERRGAGIAAALLGAAGLAHPLFFLLGAAILALGAAMAWRRDRAEAIRTGGAVLGGGAIVGAGLLSLLVGPPPAHVDTSRDAFLRRAGLLGELRSSYLDRFVHRWTRYVEWVSVPLAGFGLVGLEGFIGRFLGAWTIVTVTGVGVGLATGWFPADRFITFGFAVPILAAIGLGRLDRRLGARRAAAVVVVGGLTLAMLSGAYLAWDRQEPFLSTQEVRAATVANSLTTGLDEGVPLVFLVNEPDASVGFLATRAGNVIRASVPPDRIRDVVVVVPPSGATDATAERRALERLTAADRLRAERTSGRPAQVFVLAPFDPVDAPSSREIGVEAGASPASPPTDPLEPSTPAGIVLSSVLVLALVGAVGFGWARIASPDPVTAAALAPAVGAGVLILVGIALERVGIAIGSGIGAWTASAVAAGGGYLVRGVLERRARARAAPEVEQ